MVLEELTEYKDKGTNNEENLAIRSSLCICASIIIFIVGIEWREVLRLFSPEP